MEAAVIREGVLRKTWEVKLKDHVKDDGLSVDVSTLTGTQASTLFGVNKTQTKDRESGKDSRPYAGIITAALGDCGHDDLLNRTEGNLRAGFCVQCNTNAIFYQYAT